MGLQKLLAAESEVNIMKEELIQLQPKLIATGKQVRCCLNGQRADADVVTPSTCLRPGCMQAVQGSLRQPVAKNGEPRITFCCMQVEETLVVVNSQTEAATAKKAVVQAEEAAASIKATSAKAIKVRACPHMLQRQWLC